MTCYCSGLQGEIEHLGRGISCDFEVLRSHPRSSHHPQAEHHQITRAPLDDPPVARKKALKAVDDAMRHLRQQLIDLGAMGLRTRRRRLSENKGSPALVRWRCWPKRRPSPCASAPAASPHPPKRQDRSEKGSKGSRLVADLTHWILTALRRDIALRPASGIMG